MYFYLLPFAFVVILFVIRVFYVVRHYDGRRFFKNSAKTLIVIGSGGHTAEMIRQLVRLDPDLYKPRLYVLADSDISSKSKIECVESSFESTDYSIKEIPRSRSVKQSYFTSVFTTLYSCLACIPIVICFKPDLILCNGPGTCIPVCIVGFLMRVLFISDTRIVFIESICRVKTLSLSGKILINFADKVLVQWRELHEKYPKTEYIGRLM